MGKVFSQEKVEKAVNLLSEFYIVQTGADKFVLRPRTGTGYVKFDYTIRTLEELGYRRLPSADKKIAVMKLPTKKLKFRNEIPGENIVRKLQNGNFELQPAPQPFKGQGWSHIIVLQRIVDTSSPEVISQMLNDLITELKRYGYRVNMPNAAGNIILVSSSEKSSSKLNETEYNRLISILVKAA